MLAGVVRAPGAGVVRAPGAGVVREAGAGVVRDAGVVVVREAGVVVGRPLVPGVVRPPEVDGAGRVGRLGVAGRLAPVRLALDVLPELRGAVRLELRGALLDDEDGVARSAKSSLSSPSQVCPKSKKPMAPHPVLQFWWPEYG